MHTNPSLFIVRLLSLCAAWTALALFTQAAGAAEVPFDSSQSIGAISDADAVELADLDGDGDLDIVITSTPIQWFENTAGDGSMWTVDTVVSSGVVPYEDVAVGDIDGDGDLDVMGIILNFLTSSGVYWVENTAGDGSAWADDQIVFIFDTGRGVDLGDIDGDGDLDGIAAGDTGLRFVRNNNGLGTSWNTSTITTGFNATSVAVADMDGDGDLDALASSVSGNEVSWFDNTAGSGSSWTQRTVSTGRTDAESAEPADVDGDGDLDVFFGSPSDGLFAWVENTAGDGTAWTEHTIDTGATSPVDVRPADLDMDGDLDLVAVDGSGFTVDWWENTAGDGSAWAQRSIEASTGDARAVVVGDVDGDGDPDLVGTDVTDGEVVWWENLTLHRSAVFPAQSIAEGSFTDVEDFAIGDVDGDGDPDLLGVATGEDLSWWKNTAGDGSAWTQTIIAAIQDGRAVKAVDMDLDGDLDALFASESSDILWVENTVGDGSSWTTRTIDNTTLLALGIDAADVDGDGDPDVVATDFDANSIFWFENTAGTALAWTKSTVDASVSGAQGLEAADLDGDGDVDIVATVESAGDVAWWENTAGDGSAWTKGTIDGDFGAPESVTSTSWVRRTCSTASPGGRTPRGMPRLGRDGPWTMRSSARRT